MQLEILSPDKTIFEGEVKFITVPGLDGSLGVLDNHAPLITTLKEGTIKIEKSEGEENFTIKGGVIEVLKNKVIILAE